MGRVTDVTMFDGEGQRGTEMHARIISALKGSRSTLFSGMCELDCGFRNGTQSGSRLTRIVRTSDEFCQHDRVGTGQKRDESLPLH